VKRLADDYGYALSIGRSGPTMFPHTPARRDGPALLERSEPLSPERLGVPSPSRS
jgi:hypothetical protein